MSLIEIKAPSPGESIAEVQVAVWKKNDGDLVRKDEILCEIESDKATLEVPASAAGRLQIKVAAGDMTKVGGVICVIDTDAAGAAEEKASPVAGRQSPAGNYAAGTPSPAAAKIMAERSVAATSVAGTGRDGRITKVDAEMASSKPATGDRRPVPDQRLALDDRPVRRERMSMLRKSLAERLVAVKNQTAMLTTFNEVDMSFLAALRAQHKVSFEKTHGVKLGMMSFFVRAVIASLKNFPAVGAMIDGREFVYPDYVDMGIAVSAPKGLMVPVIRNAHTLNSAQIEIAIRDLSERARDNKLTLEEMTGGTFTVSNGGVFGSMLSTPILNPPQSAILGMHNIVERPVAVNGHVVIRPIMYVALSYDHRIIDGRESVGFLKGVKELLEKPEGLLS